MQQPNSLRKFVAVKRYALLCATFGALLLAMFVPHASHAQYGRDTVHFHCQANQTIYIGQALAGKGESNDTLVVLDTGLRSGDTLQRMDSADAKRVYTIVGDSGLFVADSSHQLVFQVTFRPPDTNTYFYEFSIYNHREQCADTIRLWGRGIDTTSSANPLPLATSLPQTVAFVAKSDTSDYRIPFYNNLPVTVTIDSASFLRGTSIHLDRGSISLPLSVPAFSRFSLPLIFTPKQKGQNSDYLIISAPFEPVLHDVVPIQGFFDPPPDFVRIDVSHAAHFAVYPNPSRRDVTVHSDGLSRSRIEIMDMLGRSVETDAFDGDWRWHREAALPAGAYFLVVTGTTESGQSIREEQTILLE